MKLDITTIQNGKEREKKFEYALDPAECDAAVYFGDEVTLTAPLEVTVTVTDRGEYIGVLADAAVVYEKECARCLAPVECRTECSFERYIPGKGKSSDAFDEDDVITVTDGEIDVDAAICEEAALSLPTIVLCSDDCPGLCPKCGKRLADGDCGCLKVKEIDPRMKIFEKLLEEDK